MGRLRLGIVTVAVVLGGLLLAACGGSAPVSGWTSTQYSSREYGFSILYPSSFERLEIPAEETGEDRPLLHVFFADPEGATIAGKSVDALDVAVYQMNGAPTRADLKKHKRDFESMAVTLVGRPRGLRFAEPFTWGTFAGEPALEGVYTYTIAGEDVAASATLVFRGARAYFVRAQASRATWGATGKLLASSVATFTFL